MASRRNPFFALRCLGSCSTLFGILSIIVGVSEMCVWLAVLGVFGNISKDEKLWLDHSYGGASGFVLVFLSASGLWCGFWMFCTGVCGCTIRVGQPSDKNNRTRIVVCLASGFNAIIFCPVQIALYAFLFTPEKAWFNELYLVQPVWWAVMFQSIGIFSGVTSLFICVATLVVALRTKPYAGEARTWNEMDL